MAKAWLSRHRIAFRTIDVSRDEDARRALRELGVRRLPVLISQSGVVEGFHPDRFADLLGRQEPAASE